MVVLLSGFSAGILVERLVIDGDRSFTDTRGDSDLDTVAGVIEENYLYRPADAGAREKFREELERTAIEGMLASLDDAYTRYLVPVEAAVASDQLDGEYGGVGVTLQPAHGLLVVARITPDSPASRAGVAAGDVIQRVDGQPVDEEGEPTLIGDLRGPVGSNVELLIQRPEVTNPIRLSLTRETIIVHPVSFEMIPATSYARIRIDIFGDRTTDELDEAIAMAGTRGATGIVLDLRGNGGGWVTSAQETIGRFVEANEGPALLEDADPETGGEYELPILNPERAPTNMPIVVLVDRNTASAAEIVAGSLHDYDRALIVGEQTFGKGSVQRIFDFDDGASLRVTVAEWITPNRSRIEDAGIGPDVVVDSAAYGTTSGDPFIRAATSMLESGISRPTDLAAAGEATALRATPAAAEE
ncbi:MAG: S41 family peptidase [Chloroflexia bacterium]|nr:S41 family peptidase [Chloroflexia bacterium]